MADLEAAAEAAIVKIKELSAHIDEAEAAFTALEGKLDDVKARYETDWAELDEKAEALLERARAQAADVADEGEEARQGLTQLADSLAQAAPEWDEALGEGASETSTFGTHVSNQQPAVSAAGDDAQTGARRLAERAAAIEAHLQETQAAIRELLEGQVASELREAQDAIRQRAAALQAVLTDECETLLVEAFAGWEQQLAQVEEVIDQEFASARKHAADVVEFSLEECRRAHDEAWAETAGQLTHLEGLLQRLGDAVAARTGEVDERRSAAEEAFSDVAAALERMRSVLVQELETLARYEFVRA